MCNLEKGLKIRSTVRYCKVEGCLWFYNEVVLVQRGSERSHAIYWHIGYNNM